MLINHLGQHRRLHDFEIKIQTSLEKTDLMLEENFATDLTNDDHELHTQDTHAPQTEHPNVEQVGTLEQPTKNVNLVKIVLPKAQTDHSNNEAVKLMDMHSAIDLQQTLFALKLMSKNLLPQEVVNETLEFCEEIHARKMELITHQLSQLYKDKSVPINQVIEKVKLIDNVTGIRKELSTDYRRNKHFRTQFKFIKPVKVVIRSPEKPFYYYFPITAILSRLLNDPTCRQCIINQPFFFSGKVLLNLKNYLCLPYARHYNPRFVSFLPTF